MTNKTIQSMYELALEPESSSELASLVAAESGGRSAALLWEADDVSHQALAFCHFTPTFMADYAASTLFDPWMATLDSVTAGQATPLSRHVSPGVWEQSAFYNEFIRGHGDDTYWSLAGHFFTPDGQGVFAIHRAKGQQDFSARERGRLQALVPHLRRIMASRSAMGRLERRAEVLGETVDGWATGVLHLSATSRVLYSNRAAEALIASNDGFFLRNGALHAQRKPEQLNEALRAAAVRHVGVSLLIERPSGKSAHMVTVLPLRLRQAGATVALVLIDNPAGDPVSTTKQLMTFFRLTPAEAELALELANGRKLDEIASGKQVQMTTVRSLLSRALDKTGSRRQADLVALVIRLTQRRSSGGG